MITNRIGYSPSARQSTPQRQNVAFGGENFEERHATPVATKSIPKKSTISKIASSVWSGYKEFAKSDTVGFGHMVLLALGLGGIWGVQGGRECLAEYNVKAVISDTATRNQVFNNAKLLSGSENFDSDRREYFNQVADSVRGGKSTPNTIFDIPTRILKENFRKEMDAKADSVNRIADSLYQSAGMSNPRYQKGYIPHKIKIK